MRTSSLSVLFDTVNRPPTGMPPGTAASGLLGLTDATSKAGAAGDWATSWDARPSITARHATTTLFISAPSARRDAGSAPDVPCAASTIRRYYSPCWVVFRCRLQRTTVHRLTWVASAPEHQRLLNSTVPDDKDVHLSK